MGLVFLGVCVCVGWAAEGNMEMSASLPSGDPSICIFHQLVLCGLLPDPVSAAAPAASLTSDPPPCSHAVVAAFSQAFKRCKEAIDAGLAAFQAKDYEVST